MDISIKLDSIKKRLHLLDCPLIEDPTEQQLAEFLLHPNEGRIKLISWIVKTFDSKFGELLTEYVPIIGSRFVDASHQKLLLCLNIMGVTKIDDLELIRGTASQKKQIIFWDDLIDILYTSMKGSPYLDTSVSLDSTYSLKPVDSVATSTHVQYKDSCRFIDTLVRKHSMRSLFSTDINLFPPDLEAIVKEDAKTLQIPSINHLEELREKICADVKEKSNAKDENHYVIPDNITIDNYCRKVDLSLKTFSQMSDNYLYCYENDLKAWCAKGKKPSLSNIGQCTKTISDMKTKTFDLCDSVQIYNEVSSYLCDELKKDLNEVANRLTTTGGTIDQHTCTVLRDSISRKHSCT